MMQAVLFFPPPRILSRFQDEVVHLLECLYCSGISLVYRQAHEHTVMYDDDGANHNGTECKDEVTQACEHSLHALTSRAAWLYCTVLPPARAAAMLPMIRI